MFSQRNLTSLSHHFIHLFDLILPKNMSDLIFRWDDHAQFRTSALQELRKTEDFLDVTIACDDDQIKAHKVILSSASPFFHNILKRNPHSHPLLYLRGTKVKDIEAILEFVYSGVTYVNEEEQAGAELSQAQGS